ncbi:MAG: hypothetical protein AB1762_18315 [Gemmatimonadota bacterium]
MADALSRAVASGALARLLTYFTVRIDDTPHLRALIRHTGLGARSLQTELARLEELGLLQRVHAYAGVGGVAREFAESFISCVDRYASLDECLGGLQPSDERRT